MASGAWTRAVNGTTELILTVSSDDISRNVLQAMCEVMEAVVILSQCAPGDPAAPGPRTVFPLENKPLDDLLNAADNDFLDDTQAGSELDELFDCSGDTTAMLFPKLTPSKIRCMSFYGDINKPSNTALPVNADASRAVNAILDSVSTIKHISDTVRLSDATLDRISKMLK